MTRKEFNLELKTVVSYLWRNRSLVGPSRVHLLSLFDPGVSLPARYYTEDIDKDVVELVELTDYSGKSYNKKFRTACTKYTADQLYVVDLLIDQYFLSYSILENYGYSAEFCKRTMRTWLSKVSRWHIDFQELGVVCKRFGELVLAPLADTEDSLPARGLSRSVLNAEMRKVSPDLHWFFHPFNGMYENWVKTGSDRAFKNLYQAAEYILRGKIKTLDRYSEQHQDYLKFENEIKLSPPDDEMLSGFRKIAEIVFPEKEEAYVRTKLSPVHGAGAVSTWPRITLETKYSMINIPRRVLKVLPELIDYQPVRLPGYSGIKPDYSEIVNVPKNLLKDRLISKEEVTTQWVQHAVSNAITDWMHHKSEFLRNRINLHHAELNGELAALGSIDGHYATVDLSSASDSVTMFHIRQFPRWYKRMLCAVRCPKTKYGPDIIKLTKFAPMGASTCFPVECQVFAICAYMAVALAHGFNPQYINTQVLRHLSKFSHFRIYGDDIVIEARYVPALYRVLELLKFKVNVRKSYTQPKVNNFRESCGYEYLNGVDVSPIRTARQRVFWHNRLLSSDQLDAVIEYRNTVFMADLGLLLRLWDRRIRMTKVKVQLQKTFGWLCLAELLPRYTIDEIEGKRGLLTKSSPTNYQLRKHGLPPFEQTDLQYPVYWGITVETLPDRLREKNELVRLLKDGFVPLESDYIRWFDYWIHRTESGLPRKDKVETLEHFSDHTPSFLGARRSKLSVGMCYL